MITLFYILAKCVVLEGLLRALPPLQKEESPHNYSGDGDITNTLDCSIIVDTLQMFLERHIGTGLSGARW